MPLGIDGCAGGWLVAEAASAADVPSFRLVRRFAPLADEIARRREIALLDMPIGLADGERGRRCDAEARALLGWPRATSVFTPPSRSALRGRGDARVRALNVAACGKSLSSQCLRILPRIREVDAVLTPALQRRVREAHPEAVFARLAASGRGIAAPKRSTPGRARRLALLPPAFAAAAPPRGALPFPARVAAPDDYVDALALLVAALDLAAGTGGRLPRRAERDARGLSMEIVF
jgi:predicted RNase H-like nuclease